jgi:hypothetical protein
MENNNKNNMTQEQYNEELRKQEEIKKFQAQEEIKKQESIKKQIEFDNFLKAKEKVKKEKPEKIKKEKPKRNSEISFVLMLTNVLTLLTALGLGVSLVLFKGTIAWIGAAFTFLLVSMILIFFIVFIGKKTHALQELNAILTGKPISLFFTDHKKMEWRVVEPEGNILTDKKYGSFLVNEKSAYVDAKTKNIFIAFNPAVGTSAELECYKVSDNLNKILSDEKKVSQIRQMLSLGSVKNETIVYVDPVTNKEEVLNDFEVIRENVNFSHLKSLLNTLIPHSLTSKIEMTVQQRTAGLGKVNVLQIILLILGLVGGVTICIILLKMYGSGGGTTTVIKEMANVAVNSSNIIRG